MAAFFILFFGAQIIYYASIPPSTKIGGLTVDEDGRPVRGNISVVVNGTPFARTPTEEEVSVDEWCDSGEYNYEFTVPGRLPGTPVRGCQRLMLPELAPGDSWRRTTIDGEYNIVVENLGDSYQIPSSITFPEGEGENGPAAGDLPADSLAQSNLLVNWIVIVVGVLSVGLAVFLAFVRPNWRVTSSQVSRKRRTSSRSGRATSSQTSTREHLTTHFSSGELRDLCFDLDIDYDSLPGNGKSDKARELVAYCLRHGRAQELVARCRELRPQISWDHGAD